MLRPGSKFRQAGPEAPGGFRVEDFQGPVSANVGVGKQPLLHGHVADDLQKKPGGAFHPFRRSWNGRFPQKQTHGIGQKHRRQPHVPVRGGFQAPLERMMAGRRPPGFRTAKPVPDVV
jgi:hypothetical protein